MFLSVWVCASFRRASCEDMTGSAEHEAALLGLCEQFVEVHRRLAQLESLLPEEELPPPPAKRLCTTQVTVAGRRPELTEGPRPEPTEGCGSQPSSEMPHDQSCRCAKGHPLKRSAAGTRTLVCDGPCGKPLRRNTARWSCASCDFDLCAARHPFHRTCPLCRYDPAQSASSRPHASSRQVLEVCRR